MQSGLGFSVGDTVQILFKAIGKTHQPPFEGTVIYLRGEGENKTFCVRRISPSKVAIERIFPLNSPFIEKVKTVKRSSVRRAKLYYLRGK